METASTSVTVGPSWPGVRRLLMTIAFTIASGACSATSASSTPPVSASAVASDAASPAGPSSGVPSSDVPSPAAFDPLTFPSRTVAAQAVIPSSALPLALAANVDAVWVLGGGALSRIDPATNQMSKATPVAGTVLTFGSEALWSADFDSSTVTRVDPATGRALASIHVDTADGAASTSQGIWVTEHHSGSVALIDPRTNKVASVVRVGPDGAGGPQAIDMLGDRLWVGIPFSNKLVAIDPATKLVVETIDKLPDPCGEIALATGSIWVTECMDGRNVDRADPNGATFTSRVWVGGYAGTPIPVTDGIWLPITSDQSGVDGRLLKLGASGDPVDALDLGADCQPSDNLMPAVVAFGSVWIGCDNGKVIRLAATDLP